MIKKFVKIIFNRVRFIYFKLLGVNFYYSSGNLKISNSINLFYSQQNQDIIVLNFLKNNFSLNDNIKIIDIGANHPIKFNNTMLFEKLFNAEIYSIDAQNTFKKIFQETRKSTFINCAIGQCREEITFFVPKGSNDNHDNNMFASSDINFIPLDLANCIDEIKVTKCPLIDVVPIQEYDILFIDVEGFEEDVLNGIDFSKFNFKIICIENNRSIKSKKTIRKMLLQNHYCWVGRILGFDDIFIFEDNNTLYN